MRAACEGMDAIIHLAGLAVESTWEAMVEVNVNGTMNVLEGARQERVDRVILASSNHAVGFRSRDEGIPLAADLPPRPDTFYGVSKAAIEALGSLYHSRVGMHVVSLRLGTVSATPQDVRSLATWLSPGDCARLLNACLEHPGPGYRTAWGVSDNTRRWWSLEEAQALGYQPLDDAERHAHLIPGGHASTDIADPLHARVGGAFCTVPLGVDMTAAPASDQGPLG